MQKRKLRHSPAAAYALRFVIGILFGALRLSAQNNYTCPSTSGPAGPDYHGRSLKESNFTGQDLTNANFAWATLEAPVFVGANLTGANFSHATITNGSSNPELVADFSSAILTGACFIGTQFAGTTYFNDATFTCADFSSTDLTSGNAIFDDGSLKFDRTRTDCQPAFRSTVMNCDFVGDWRYLNLNAAKIGACLSALAGQDFSNAQMANVDFHQAVLDGVNFSGADLTGAILTGSSLQNVDLSHAHLQASKLDKTNLTGASLYGALLSNDDGKNISDAASLTQAHLKNANLSSATVSGVDFTNANFYGNNASEAGTCKVVAKGQDCNTSQHKRHRPEAEGGDPYEGFTCSCAAANKAVMNNTKFINAYLFGVDFTNSQGQGANFYEAVLTGANFSGASFVTDPNSASGSSFNRAFLQGANLSATFDSGTTFEDAFVDFNGNSIYILLSGGNHNQFACTQCKPATGSDVCVAVLYPNPTAPPGGKVNVTCPDNSVGNCGPADPSGNNLRWKSSIDLGMPPPGVPPAWYAQNSTYLNAPADPGVICGGKGASNATFYW